MKISEAAKKLSLSPKALVILLKELGFPKRGYTSYLSFEEYEALKRKIKEEEADVKKHFKEKRKQTTDQPRGSNDEVGLQKRVRKTVSLIERRPLMKFKRKEKEEKQEPSIMAASKVEVTPNMTVSELACAFDTTPQEVIKTCLSLGLIATINQRLDLDTIALLADEFGKTIEIKEESEAWLKIEGAPLLSRPPVVVVIGHVDHGKTTLLDCIRKTKVAEKEVGRITQHVGVSSVNFRGEKIIFLDTPGHEAFTEMRARGVHLTDIAILVVAGDEGVMPQTEEAINHVRAASVPIIVAITKIDLPQANPERVKAQLARYGIRVEGYGGDIIAVETSAHTGYGIDDLLSAILLISHIQEFKAPYAGPGRGVVVDSRLDRGRGIIATVLVQEGTINKGNFFFCGEEYGRVRGLFDVVPGRFIPLEKSDPATPAQIIGFSGTPQPGERFIAVENERIARELAYKKSLAKRDQKIKFQKKLSLQTIQERIKTGETKELKIVLKADVMGSAEALKNSLEELSLEEVRIKIIHSGVGPITKSDVLLAAASEAIVIGYHIEALPEAKTTAEVENVEIRTYNIIYSAIDDIRAAMLGLLEPEKKEIIIGRAIVRQIFNISKVGLIVGVYVQEGKVERECLVRIFRKDKEIFQGKITSLKRFKEDVREVEQGFECGIGISNLEDAQPEDLLVFYKIEE